MATYTLAQLLAVLTPPLDLDLQTLVLAPARQVLVEAPPQAEPHPVRLAAGPNAIVAADHAALALRRRVRALALDAALSSASGGAAGKCNTTGAWVPRPSSWPISCRGTRAPPGPPRPS